MCMHAYVCVCVYTYVYVRHRAPGGPPNLAFLASRRGETQGWANQNCQTIFESPCWSGVRFVEAKRPLKKSNYNKLRVDSKFRV